MKLVSYIIASDKNINVFLNDKSYIVTPDHINYDKVISCIRKEKGDQLFDELKKLIDIADSLKKSAPEVTIKNGEVYYNGKVLVNSLTERLFMLVKSDMPYEPLWKFLLNVSLNPSEYAINELYEFLEKNNLPITEDGCFLAYKKVRNDYFDIHSGTMNNSVGNVVKIDRTVVDPNRNNECSVGLHFCSKEYLPHFGSNNCSDDHVLIVKINPKDVVSFPRDYNLSKGRCCEYTVMYEIGMWSDFGYHTTSELNEKIEFDQPLYTNEDLEIKKESSKNTTSAWTMEDIDLLIRVRRRLSDATWNEIAKEFNIHTKNQHRTPSACRHCYSKNK